MLAAIPLWGLTSCLDDNKYAYFHPNESWGTIVGTPENFKIETDNGNTLRVPENLDPSFPVEDSLSLLYPSDVVGEEDSGVPDGRRNLPTKKNMKEHRVKIR